MPLSRLSGIPHRRRLPPKGTPTPTDVDDEAVRDDAGIALEDLEGDAGEVLLPVDERGSAELQAPGRTAQEEQVRVGGSPVARAISRRRLSIS